MAATVEQQQRLLARYGGEAPSGAGGDFMRRLANKYEQQKSRGAPGGPISMGIIGEKMREGKEMIGEELYKQFFERAPYEGYATPRGDEWREQFMREAELRRGRAAPTMTPAQVQAAQIAATQAPQAAQAQAAQMQALAGPTAARVAAPAGPTAARVAAPAGITAAQMQLDPQAQFRQGQMRLAGALSARAEGRGAPSPAELQLQRGMEQQIAAARSMAASQPGLSAGARARMASQGAQRAMMETNQQAAILRAQETQQAQQALGAVLGQGRGADIGIAGQQAGMQQQAGMLSAQQAQQAALAQAGMQQQAGMLGSQQAQQTALANLQAQQQANLATAQFGQQANMLGSQQALQTALAQAGFGQQANLATAQFGQQAAGTNLNAILQQQAANDAAVAQYLGLARGVDTTALEAQLRRAQIAAGIQQTQQSLAAQAEMQQQANATARQNAWIGGGLGALGAIGGAVFGGPVGAAIGKTVGSELGQTIQK